MPRTLSDKGAKAAADAPAYYDGDPLAEAVFDGCGRELQRVEDAASAVLRGALPGHADDTYGLLSLWETTLGLPVAPPGVALADRQRLAAARYARRDVAKARDAADAITDVLGSGWSFEDGATPFTGTLVIPIVEGGYTASQALSLVREFFPGNLVISPVYNERFLVGRSPVGFTRL